MMRGGNLLGHGIKVNVNFGTMLVKLVGMVKTTFSKLLSNFKSISLVTRRGNLLILGEGSKARVNFGTVFRLQF